MEAEALSSYSKQADNIFISVEVMDFLYYEEANIQQTVATEAEHGVGIILHITLYTVNY